MSRMPEASFVSSAPTASGSSSPSSDASSSSGNALLYWVGVCVLALIGWAASTSVQLAHARDVSWSIGVDVPGGVIRARSDPPVVVYREPVYRAPVVVQRPPAYIVSPPVTVVEYPRWDERHDWRHHHHHNHHGYGHRYEGPRYPDPYANRHPHHRGDW